MLIQLIEDVIISCHAFSSGFPAWLEPSVNHQDKQACHLLQTASEFRGKGKSAPKLSKLVDPVGKSTGVCLPSLSDQDRHRKQVRKVVKHCKAA